ncbi:N-acetylglucosamine-6-phosphate deacetylase [Kribbella kalugense]|uniref:N-acetylglucosamine 6-phosphate deacetylase n=1 Tax=Kribbella kalugense TaxID=2512221 RepID=A0A4R8A4K9_9ACTN|nr:amidohydrolase family protein [Kribbella kalugense]TDW23200.1 N-acetylglucosamine 6-phosphate deacetylase [Kribbella kalugense]
MPAEALVGPRVVLEDAVLDDHAVLVRDGRIEAIVPASQVPADAVRRDLGDGILTPGLIDIHTHGASGHSFNEGTKPATRAALSGLLAAGVTTVLPTIATAPLEDIEAAVDAIASFQGEPGLPRIPGAHLEGPYFARAQCGAQDPDHLRSPDDGSIDRLLDQAAAIRMISYAPELPGAVALTRRLVEADIVPAAGHSDGRDEDLLACQEAGLRHVIHIFSGQSSTVRRGPWRQPGLLEATLTSDGLTVEMIADGKHLPPTLLRLAHRCLRGRLCLVSDSTPGAGLPDGEHYRMGRREYVVSDGVGMTLDRTAFGGSTTLLPAMIPIALEALGIELPEAVAMASVVPARAAGLADVGRIAPGCHADFALFTEDLTLRAVAVGGHWNDIDALTGKEPPR